MSKLSEDEIIDRVMMIEQWKTADDIYTQDELNAIGQLVDLYQDEKKEKEGIYADYQDLGKDYYKLQEKLEEEQKISHFLQSELDQANAKIIEYKKQLDLNYVEENYISKDKIREKLKIRKEEKAECTDSTQANLILREIYLLEELLEE